MWAYLAAGLILVAMNYWFFRSAYRLIRPHEFVILPLQVSARSGTAPDGRTLATMLRSRLGQIQRSLNQRASRPSAEAAGAPPKSTRSVAALFVSDPVSIPAGLFTSVDIKANVAGVEVGGILSWIAGMFSQPNALVFTLIEKEGGWTVSGELGRFVANADPHVFFETEGDVGQAVTELAYALVQKRIEDKKKVQISSLAPHDFRTLLQTVLEADALNDRVNDGHVVDEEFARLLARIQPLHRTLPEWHELTFLLGSLAESAGNQQAAQEYYGKISAAASSTKPPSPELLALLKPRLSKFPEPRTAAPTEARARFIQNARRFAELMNLADPTPAISFKEHQAGLLLLWNEDTGKIEVNTASIDSPGLPQHVALMRDFMERHYKRCFGKNIRSADARFWREFRESAISYLVGSVPEFGKADASIAQAFPPYRWLVAVERAAGVKQTQRLALELMRRYDCDWSYDNFGEHVAKINREHGFVAPEPLRASLAQLSAPD